MAIEIGNEVAGGGLIGLLSAFFGIFKFNNRRIDRKINDKIELSEAKTYGEIKLLKNDIKHIKETTDRIESLMK